MTQEQAVIEVAVTVPMKIEVAATASGDAPAQPWKDHNAKRKDHAND